MTQHIAFYGTGGVGKSTLVSNVGSAMVEAGFSVMQVGCDPKSESCALQNNGEPISTVFDLVRGNADISVGDIVHHGFKGIACVELGDPFVSGACAASEIAEAFACLDRIKLFETISPDFVLYDISFDNSCAGFCAPILQLGIRRAFVVATGDFMSLHAVNSIFRMLERYGEANEPVPIGGVIPNSLTSSFEESFIADFAKHTRTQTLGLIPRSLMVRQCELFGKTVIESAPSSNQSYYYRRLANQIVDNAQSDKEQGPPVPMSPGKLREWAQEWGDRLFALENGLMSDGAAI